MSKEIDIQKLHEALEALDDLEEVESLIHTLQLSRSRYDFIMGAMLGILGNLLVSYWMEFQHLYLGFTTESVIIGVVVYIICIYVLFHSHKRYYKRIEKIESKAMIILSREPQIRAVFKQIMEDYYSEEESIEESE